MNKTITALLLAGVLSIFGATAAQAYVPPATATVSDPVVAPGETFIFSGSGMNPGEPVDIFITNEAPAAAGIGGTTGGRLGAAQGVIVLGATFNLSTTADADGNFSVPVTLSEPGTYTLTATGRISGTQVTAVVTVVAAAADVEAVATGENLPETGADASLLLWGAAGVGALGLGAASIAVSRRRKA